MENIYFLGNYIEIKESRLKKESEKYHGSKQGREWVEHSFLKFGKS